MSESMKAVMASGAGGPEVLDVVTVPRPTAAPGQVLVRIHAAGINRPDVMQREGNYPPPPGASDILGLEIAGVVEALGEGATRFAIGDRVMALVPSGGYAEFCAVHETNALPVPDGMSMTEAGAFPETYFTVWSNVFQRAALKKGETILLHGGTSGIGTTTILLAKALGCRVIVTCGSDEKCESAKANGADVAINYKTSDFVTEAKKATDGKGPEVVLDMVGGEYMQRNIEAVAIDGRIAQIAFQKPPKADLNMLQLLTKRLTWTGSTLRARPVEMKAELARALEEHVLPLLAKGIAKPVIDSTYSLNDVRQAHARMDSGGHVGKIVLTMIA
ncbi:NAD(P)H-quinone oxidoreductase [Pseudorhodobacter turbinis]|uniref:NAD(P)H-quinone oxidoreductase n=1 Tax=Pseudorhodobacter turbinis TaxID=2500533 RepID=A0A4P8EFX8_9RHOB|nr:NAD(P)H-quinone oxidoreductase [Pseudorhodobacter turbinis]QCO55395.1 NAD(P)H-quinone oxidoreductase [Pseudorhodobacter turbinis]